MATTTTTSSSKLVLFAVDEESDDCLNWYISNIHREEYTLLLVHVHQMPPMMAVGIMGESLMLLEGYDEIVAASVQRSKDLLQRLAVKCQQAHVSYKKLLESDDGKSSGKVLVRVAKDRHVDMIVVGTRGLGTIGRLFLGSTSHYVLHHVRIPVVVVPRSEEKQ